jgi:gas vesicle protein
MEWTGTALFLGGVMTGVVTTLISLAIADTLGSIRNGVDTIRMEVRNNTTSIQSWSSKMHKEIEDLSSKMTDQKKEEPVQVQEETEEEDEDEPGFNRNV